MLNLILGPSILLAIALAGVGVLFFRHSRLIASGNLSMSESDYPDLRVTLQKKVNRFYLNFAFFFKQLGHYLYFYSLLVMRRLVIWSKIILILIEKRFSRLIDSVHGKGVMDKRGAVSLFLANISKK